MAFRHKTSVKFVKVCENILLVKVILLFFFFFGKELFHCLVSRVYGFQPGLLRAMDTPPEGEVSAAYDKVVYVFDDPLPTEDGDFEVTAEMLIHDTMDDETTLAEEEATRTHEEDEAELSELQEV